MRKILTFGDLHISSFHQFSRIDPTGFSTRELEHLEVANDIVKYLQEHTGEVESVVFLGDLIHPVGGNISCDNLLTATEFISRIQEECIKQNIIFYLLVGNHDLNAINGNIASHKLVPFKKWQNIKIVDNLEECGNYVFLPFTHTPLDSVTAFLESIQNKDQKIIFSHVDIRGADMGAGIIVERGIDKDLLGQFRAVFQGHYHVPQKLGANIWVTGSTQKTSFKDPGGGSLIIYDLDESTVTRQKFNVPDWVTFYEDEVEKIPLTSSNSYVKIVVSSDSVLDQYNISPEMLGRFKGCEKVIEVERISAKRLHRTDEEMIEELPETIITNFIKSSIDIDPGQQESYIQKGLDLINRAKQ